MSNFRNYKYQKLNFEDKINILYGKNGQGKTNIIEAIIMLSVAKSYRTNSSENLIMFKNNKAEISGSIKKSTGCLQLGLTLSKKGKTAFINGLEINKLSQYLGYFNVIVFAPEDLLLIKGTPQTRRRFLDIEIGQISKIYINNLAEYNKILNQRNSLLKKLSNKQNEKENLMFLDILTNQLIKKIEVIAKERSFFLFYLQKNTEKILSVLAKEKEEINIKYHSLSLAKESLNVNEINKEYEEQFFKIKQKEIERGVTLIGPHRDDFSLYVNNKNIQLYGSQGQQRTMTLAIKLAEIELIYKKTGEYPVLLLDDVLSELDNYRQNALLDYIQKKVQTFITTTGVETIRKKTVSNASCFLVQEGTIK